MRRGVRREKYNRFFIKNLNLSTDIILTEPESGRWGIFTAASLVNEKIEYVDKLELVRTPIGWAYKVGEFYYLFNDVHKGLIALSMLTTEDGLTFYIKKGKYSKTKEPFNLLIINYGALCLAVTGFHEKEILD